MKATIRIAAPHPGQRSGSTSKTCRKSSAQRRRASRIGSGTGSATGGGPTAGCSPRRAAHTIGVVAVIPGHLLVLVGNVRCHARARNALLRSLEPDLHNAEGVINLAERKPREAMAQFRWGDSLPDGPATWSATSLPRYPGLAFDAANQPYSAIAHCEQVISTPDLLRSEATLDPMTLPSIRERLGQLYDPRSDTARAVEQYRAFIERWKSADPELQPRVAAARADWPCWRQWRCRDRASGNRRRPSSTAAGCRAATRDTLRTGTARPGDGRGSKEC